MAHRPPHQTHLFLAHLSEQNNHPDKALEAFALYQKDMHISVASRYEVSGLYHIRSNNTYPLAGTFLPGQANEPFPLKIWFNVTAIIFLHAVSVHIARIISS